MKRAILAVSFGTTYQEEEHRCIRPIEEALRRAYPDYSIFRAYTSRVIVKKQREKGVEAEKMNEALERLRREGFDEIVLASVHVIPGGEYGKVCAAAGENRVSEPLLSDEDDLKWMASLLESVAQEEGRLLLVMGHGSECAADAIYLRLREFLPSCVRLACLEGEHTLDALLPELDALDEKLVTLMPLMIVAGSHARSNLAGEDSWKSMLETRGFDVRVRMQGLGAFEQVQQRFVEKAGRVLSDQTPVSAR